MFYTASLYTHIYIYIHRLRAPIRGSGEESENFFIFCSTLFVMEKNLQQPTV